MWLLSDGAQAAETASLSPCTVEQSQNRWGASGGEFAASGNYEERMRSLIPPAFRSGNSKVLWEDPSRSLEANVNEALGITGWSTASGCQYNEPPDTPNASNQYPAAFTTCAPGGWPHSEFDQQRVWDAAPHTNVSSGSMRGAVSYCGNGVPAKCWPMGSEELTWGGHAARPPALHCCPPPVFTPPNAGWQAHGTRNAMFAPPPNRFTGTTFEGGVTGAGPWVPRGAPNPGVPPPTAMPPPQRSRFQSMWATNANVNGGTASSLCMPPPGMDFNMPNGMGQWTPPGSATGGPAARQHAPHYTNRSSPPMSAGTFSLPPTSNSSLFMGEDSMWQDPNGEVRKWQRDTGTGVWGNPDKQPGDIRRWLVPEDAELHAANDSGATTDTNTTASTQRDASDSKGRTIVPMGWGDLPALASSQKSPSTAGTPTCSGTFSTTNTNTWSGTASQTSNTTTGGWDPRAAAGVKSPASVWDTAPADEPPRVRPNAWSTTFSAVPDSNISAATQLIAQQLRAAINKGTSYLTVVQRCFEVQRSVSSGGSSQAVKALDYRPR